MIPALRVAAVSTGGDILGIKKEDIGMHLIKSGVTMTMYLGKCPVYIHHYDDRRMVQRCLSRVHQKTGGTVQPQCISENSEVSVPQMYPNLGTLSLTLGPKTTQPPRQCRDHGDK